MSVTSTVEARIVGFREALLSHGHAVEPHFVQCLASIGSDTLERVIKKLRPEGFVCVNDRTAGRLMQSLLSLGHQRLAEEASHGTTHHRHRSW